MTPLFSYLDPGSGSMLLQALVAGAAGLMVALKFALQSMLPSLRGRWKRREK
jgi:hypothetical protein